MLWMKYMSQAFFELIVCCTLEENFRCVVYDCGSANIHIQQNLKQ